MCSKEHKEILDWELSLDNSDLRAHAWYHGNITRQVAESLLKADGDFLVRDCSSSGRAGDFVLSCRWENTNLHFLIHKDVMQKDTIYEQLRYRFESDSFDTVPDLITYHVGSGMSISEKSGAKIVSPQNRNMPISLNTESGNSCWGNNDYALLAKDWPPQLIEAALVSKTSTLERSKPPTLNLKPQVELAEDLNEIPPRISQLILEAEQNTDHLKKCTESNYDLSNFESILLPASGDACLDQSLLEVIVARILEASDKSVALHLTKMDWEIFTGEKMEINVDDEGINADSSEVQEEKSENKEDTAVSVEEEKSESLKEKVEKQLELSSDEYKTNELYEKIFTDSQYRWNNAIERSLTLTHFVVVTILRGGKPEEMLSKWIRVAQTLKTSMGNLFSFCSIMRGLMMKQITQPDGKINWLLLRRDFTEVTFSFETTFRKAFHGYENGYEDYPPNTTIPNLFPVALVLEDNLEVLFQSCPNSEDETLHFLQRHMSLTQNLSTWSSVQKRNMERHLAEIALINDIVLDDIFRTEFQLCFLWGDAYGKEEKSLKSRCDILDTLL